MDDSKFNINKPQNFNYDVFLSHSSKDKIVVHDLAERLRADGIRVWLDEWVIQPGDMIGLKIEQGLEESRILMLAMSENAFASEWTTLERHTALFRDPTNVERRFIPLLLENCQIKDTLKQFLYLDWREKNNEQYNRILSALRPNAELDQSEANHFNKTTKTSKESLWQTKSSKIILFICFLVFAAVVAIIFVSNQLIILSNPSANSISNFNANTNTIISNTNIISKNLNQENPQGNFQSTTPAYNGKVAGKTTKNSPSPNVTVSSRKENRTPKITKPDPNATPSDSTLIPSPSNPE